MQLAAILVAAGTGSRFGAETPKQFLSLLGQPVIRHAANALIQAGATLQPVGDQAAIDAALAGLPHLPTVPGGATRQDSVRAGLEALAPHAPDIVLVHDAARALTPAGLIVRVVSALRDGHTAVVPVLPVSDTIKAVDANGVVLSTPERASLRCCCSSYSLLRRCPTRRITSSASRRVNLPQLSSTPA